MRNVACVVALCGKFATRRSDARGGCLKPARIAPAAYGAGRPGQRAITAATAKTA